MKKIIIVLFGILLVSCNQNKKENTTIDQQEAENKTGALDFDWLIGEWKRIDEEEGKETFENWSKDSETHYSGIGFTMQDTDTIWQERIKLIKNDGEWHLSVKAPEEKESTIFKMSEHTEKEFTCINTEIEFPNTIHYWKNGNRIHATVSNSELEISFEFERLNP